LPKESAPGRNPRSIQPAQLRMRSPQTLLPTLFVWYDQGRWRRHEIAGSSTAPLPDKLRAATGPYELTLPHKRNAD